MQSLDLAANESMFARDLALRSVQVAQTGEIDRANTRLAYIAEQRTEQALQAQLASNPADFVESQNYLRGLEGSPEILALSEEFAGQGGGFQVFGETLPENLLGEPYVAGNPPYTDETIQGVGNDLFTGGVRSLYNPDLGGEGQFGVNVASPNEISRRQLGSFSGDELGLIESFVKGGVKKGTNNQLIGINPADYWKQVQQSFTPGLSGSLRTNF